MRDQIVDIETAKLAKEKGFNYPCENYYYDEFDKVTLLKDEATDYSTYQKGSKYECIGAPSQTLLHKWLREQHEIDVEVGVYTRPHYCVSIVDKFSNVIYINNPEPIPTFEEHPRAFLNYEQVLEIGLQEALKVI